MSGGGRHQSRQISLDVEMRQPPTQHEFVFTRDPERVPSDRAAGVLIRDNSVEVEINAEHFGTVPGFHWEDVWNVFYQEAEILTPTMPPLCPLTLREYLMGHGRPTRPRQVDMVLRILAKPRSGSAEWSCSIDRNRSRHQARG